MDLDDKPRINAKTFQEPLWKLAEAMAQLVSHEGMNHLPGPAFVAEDIHMMIRQAIATYNLLFYLNADERREQDCYWNNNYGVVTAPLVRSMIDCLYNITLILEDPAENGVAYHKSGLKKRLLDIEGDQQTYAGRPEWDSYNEQQMQALDWLIRASGFTEAEIRNAKTWKPLGTYILQGKPEDATPHQKFLKTFTHMQWRQYSALSHASFDGYIGEIPAGAYFVLDRFPHEERPKIEEMYLAFLTRHIGRAALATLCIVTELQLYFRFRGHEINERIQKMWEALLGVFEIKEIYDERYHPLMIARGISTNK
ncbi:MAG: hypothetical protein ABSG56_04640 [Bryobacteraceae bacterium]|jgi:hypothetical protein